jgi:hypothetical protein
MICAKVCRVRVDSSVVPDRICVADAPRSWRDPRLRAAQRGPPLRQFCKQPSHFDMIWLEMQE